MRAIIDDDLPFHAREHGAHAIERLRLLHGRTPIIGDVRCPGLMVCFEVVRDRVSIEPAPKETSEIFRRAQATDFNLAANWAASRARPKAAVR